MSSVRRTRSPSSDNRLSRRLRSRMTCWDFSGFDHKLGSAACFSISTNCWRSLPASKILPQVVNLGLYRGILLFQFIQHFVSLFSRKPQSPLRARAGKLSHTDMRTNPRAAYRTWYSKKLHTAPPAPFAPSAEPLRPPAPTDQSPPSTRCWWRSTPSVHSQSPASASVADVVSRRRYRRTTHHSKYLDRPAPRRAQTAAPRPEKSTRSR